MPSETPGSGLRVNTSGGTAHLLRNLTAERFHYARQLTPSFAKLARSRQSVPPSVKGECSPAHQQLEHTKWAGAPVFAVRRAHTFSFPADCPSVLVTACTRSTAMSPGVLVDLSPAALVNQHWSNALKDQAKLVNFNDAVTVKCATAAL